MQTMKGSAITSIGTATARSMILVSKRLSVGIRGASENISQDGFNTSTLTLPVSRSRNSSSSTTAIPANRHASKSAIVHRDDDLVDARTDGVIQKRSRDPHDTRILERALIAVGPDEGDDVEPAPVATPAKLQQAPGELARSVHEHAALKHLLLFDPAPEHDADDAEQDRGQHEGRDP